MTKLILIAFALGLASLDATSALLSSGALGAGARNRALLAFGCVCILGTIAFGSALSVLVGARISDIGWSTILPQDTTEYRIAAVSEIVVGVGLLVWGAMRVLRPRTQPLKPGVPRGLGTVYLAGAGVLFALAAVVDPAFVSLVVIAGRAEYLWQVVTAHTIWTLVSHAPLILVLGFALSGYRERGVDLFRRAWLRVSPLAARFVTGAVLVAGTFLLLDALWWYVTGSFLMPEMKR